MSGPAIRKPLSLKKSQAQSNPGAVSSCLANSGPLSNDKENMPQQPNATIAPAALIDSKLSKPEQLDLRHDLADREELRKKVEAVVATHLAQRAEQESAERRATETKRAVYRKESVSLRREPSMRNVLSSLLVFFVIAWSAARVVLQDKEPLQHMQRLEGILDVESAAEKLPTETSLWLAVMPLELHQVSDSLSAVAADSLLEPDDDDVVQEPAVWYDQHSLMESEASAAPEVHVTDTAQPEQRGEDAAEVEMKAVLAQQSTSAVRFVGQQLQLSLGKLRAMLVNPLKAVIYRARAVVLRWWGRAMSTFRRHN